MENLEYIYCIGTEESKGKRELVPCNLVPLLDLGEKGGRNQIKKPLFHIGLGRHTYSTVFCTTVRTCRALKGVSGVTSPLLHDGITGNVTDRP